MLVGVDIDDSWLVDASLLINCKIGNVPFIYLGLSIGGNPRRQSVCVPVIKKY
jgi:hypothetical protein